MAIVSKEGVFLVCDHCEPAVELVPECPKCGRNAELAKAAGELLTAVRNLKGEPLDYSLARALTEKAKALHALLPR